MIPFDTKADYDKHYRLNGNGYSYEGMYPISKRRANLLSKAHPEIKDATILNVGSGAGCLSDILKEDHGCHVIDIDKSPWIKEIRYQTICTDIRFADEKLKLLGTFDLSITETVLSGLTDEECVEVSDSMHKFSKRVIHIVQSKSMSPFVQRSKDEFNALLPNDNIVMC